MASTSEWPTWVTSRAFSSVNRMVLPLGDHERLTQSHGAFGTVATTFARPPVAATVSMVIVDALPTPPTKKAILCPVGSHTDGPLASPETRRAFEPSTFI